MFDGAEEPGDSDSEGYVDPAHLTLGDHQARLNDLPGVIGSDIHQMPDDPASLPAHAHHLVSQTVLAITVEVTERVGYAVDTYLKQHRLVSIGFDFDTVPEQESDTPAVTFYLISTDEIYNLLNKAEYAD